jgi:RNA polymerase sigma-70 factor (ECF subfamily)
MDKPDTGADGNAIQRLWDQHAAVLWRFAWRLTGDQDRAADVVQETLLRAWQQPQVATNGQSTRAWLFTIARNMIADGWGPPEPTERGALNGALNRALVGDALAQLSTEHRAVVGRSYYQGWTTAQIAADLGIAEGIVKSQLHYALRALRQALLEMGVAQ